GRGPKPGARLSRLYVFESCYSTTGTAADHRLRMKGGEVAAAAFALAAELGVGAPGDLASATAAHKSTAKWASEIAKDLQPAKGRCAVVAGPRMPAAVHRVVHAINQARDNFGQTVTFTALPEGLAKSSVAGIEELGAALQQGQVEVLACLGTNPVYDAPADLQFGRLLREKKARHTIH